MAASTRRGGAGGSEIRTGQANSVITAAETNQLKDSAGKVGQIIVWDVGVTATLDLYDHASGNNNKVWGWVSADGKGVFALQIPMGLGIRVVTGGTAGGWTIIWS